MNINQIKRPLYYILKAILFGTFLIQSPIYTMIPGVTSTGQQPQVDPTRLYIRNFRNDSNQPARLAYRSFAESVRNVIHPGKTVAINDNFNIWMGRIIIETPDKRTEIFWDAIPGKIAINAPGSRRQYSFPKGTVDWWWMK